MRSFIWTLRARSARGDPRDRGKAVNSKVWAVRGQTTSQGKSTQWLSLGISFGLLPWPGFRCFATTPPLSPQYGKEGLSKTGGTKTKLHCGICIFPSCISLWGFFPHENTFFFRITPNPCLRDWFRNTIYCLTFLFRTAAQWGRCELEPKKLNFEPTAHYGLKAIWSEVHRTPCTRYWHSSRYRHVPCPQAWARRHCPRDFWMPT